MLTRLATLSILLVLAGCAAAPRPSSERGAAGAFGRTEVTAIRVGAADGDPRSGPQRERAYLDRLRTPTGAPVSYEREGSCCGFETPNSPLGAGMLDMYEVWGPGVGGRVRLYLNMYDPPVAGESDRAPSGFTLVAE
jgi:hypothetical protein